MKAVLITPATGPDAADKAFVEVDVADGTNASALLLDLKRLVGGDIDRLGWADNSVSVYVNETSSVDGLPYNKRAWEILGAKLNGNVVLLGYDRATGHDRQLTSKDLSRIAINRLDEAFGGLPGRIGKVLREAPDQEDRSA